MAKVTFKPSGQECEAKPGDHLLKVANRVKAGIKFSCGGVPSCAMCRIEIVSGEEHLSQIDRKETDLMGNTYFLTKQRLSCQAFIQSEGDVVVDVSEHLEEKDKLKAADTHFESSYRKPKKDWPELESEKQESKARFERKKQASRSNHKNNYKGKSELDHKKPKHKNSSKGQV